MPFVPKCDTISWWKQLVLFQERNRTVLRFKVIYWHSKNESYQGNACNSQGKHIRRKISRWKLNLISCHGDKNVIKAEIIADLNDFKSYWNDLIKDICFLAWFKCKISVSLLDLNAIKITTTATCLWSNQTCQKQQSRRFSVAANGKRTRTWNAWTILQTDTILVEGSIGVDIFKI